jgi:mRNA-degrading endonuclease RelE of RelBE toxin-antitoxin system
MRPIPNAARARASLTAATAEYSFQISDEIEGRMRRCRASVRTAIREKLGEIATSAGKGRRRAKVLDRKEPPLRFYVYEGYRVAYQLDSAGRRVVVLDVELLPID